ncbi:uncharacterized protein Bfra_011436 [Botrytis fragariae]|uniref:DUF7907 domain-containing protein n=1 Tax=Botrytis fragariae TaxID=1964551 RepID=A0A8H6AY70_9HELO|nr:uncharacterized protein Bfra_011436 [Botrytis fragariae]KAF5875674.1 hypothetical protein Bfra_011436 [Botrytis fragariae]
MLFSTTNILSTLALLTSVTSAAPTRRQTYSTPPKSTSTHFTLVANVTSGDLAINDFVLESYHTGAGTAYAVLAEDNTEANPRIFYINGTATDVRFGNSSTITDSGSEPDSFPESLTITPSDPASSSSGRSTVEINAGAGQPYVGLTASPSQTTQLHGYQGETFYACNTTLLYGPAIQLFYRGYSQETPAGCSDVALLPQCSEGSGAEDASAATVSCYDDVAAIDWSVYSA